MDRAILIDNIPDRDELGVSDEKVKDRLTIHFQKKSNGGGDVETVLYPLPSSSRKAIVVFNSKNGLDMDKLTTDDQLVKIATKIKVTVTRLPQMFTTIKAAIDPFYLNNLPRDQTDILNRELTNSAGMQVTNDGEKMWLNTKTFDRLEYASSVILKAFGVEINGEHTDIQNGVQVEANSDEHIPKGAEANVNVHTKTKNSPISSSHYKDRSRPPSKMGAVFPSRNTRETPKLHNSQYEASDGKRSNLTKEETDVQSPQQQGPFAVMPLLYHYMLLRHSNEIKAIQQQHRARFEINILPEKSEGMVTISGIDQKVTTECLVQAEDAFVTFYQKYFQIYKVKTLQCDISEEMFKRASAVTSSNFPDVLIDSSIEGEISFVGKETEISKAMKVFQEASGLSVPKRLKANHHENVEEKFEDASALGNFQHNSGTTDYVRSGARPRIQQRQQNDIFGKKDEYSLWINSVEVSIVQDDITHQRVSIIVSPSNETLVHSGGVAGALSTAAGWELQEECDSIKKKNHYRHLSVGECIATKGYKLACDQVIHVVGPIFGQRLSDKFYQDLKTTFINCLLKASTFPDAKSIAIPLVSSGSVGGPKDLCAAALIDALQEFGRSPQRGNIQKIYLVNRDKDATSALIEASRKAEGNTSTTDTKFWNPDADQTPMEVDFVKDGKSHGLQGHDLNKFSSTETGHGFEWKSSTADGNGKRKTFQSKTGMQITTVQAELENCGNIDVLVNASSDSSLQTGIGKVIAEAAGHHLVKEYNAECSKRSFPPSDGDIIVTRGYDLRCAKVMHILISPPRRGSPMTRKTVFDTVSAMILKCLNYADLTLRSQSLLLPMDKFGGGNHTPELYAESVADAIKKFQSVHQLREMYVVHPNLEMFMALEGVFGDNFTVASDEEGSLSTEVGGLKDDKEKQMTEREQFCNKTPGNSYGINDDENSEDGNNSQDDDDEEDKRCPICFDDFAGNANIEKLDLCKHKFCKPCIDRAMKDKPACPVCGKMYGVMKGNQPTGTMTSNESRYPDLPGYPGCGYIQINYSFSGGTQGPNHPNPGKYYTGTSRTAYLPNNREGQQVLKLLRKAFDAKLTFTIGTSVTTGRSDTVTWNDIHHKTSTHGGPQSFGYPDPTYLKRVTEELAAKGIK